jgi:hypothetical protein
MSAAVDGVNGLPGMLIHKPPMVTRYNEREVVPY